LDIVVVGSNMVDLLTHIRNLPKTGETLFGESFHLGFGGKGANQAVMAARLGARVGMITKVGDDVFGTMTQDNFTQMGIATQRIFIKEGMSSGVAPIFVDHDGNNIIVIIPGANLTLSPEEVRDSAEMIKSASIVISQFEISEESIITAFRIAKEAGKMTILNPAPARETHPELIRLSDIIIPNETEAEVLTGVQIQGIDSVKQASEKLFNQGANQVIITLGKLGAYLFEKDHQALFPAPEVDPIDTTGAGDAFIGSLAYALAKGLPLPDAIRFANYAAALSVTKVGTQTSFPSLADVERLIQQAATQ
jgi:ribokinase